MTQSAKEILQATTFTAEYCANWQIPTEATENADKLQLDAAVTSPEKLAEIHAKNEMAVRVPHTLAFKGYKTKYVTQFYYDGCFWAESCEKLTMNDIKLYNHLLHNCLFGYNWVVFSGSKIRENLGRGKNSIHVSLKALLDAGVFVENPTDTIAHREMADVDLSNESYLSQCRSVYELVTQSRWTPYHRIFRLNYRIAWYGRLMWLMKSPSTQFSSNFKGRSTEFVGAYNLYGTLPGLLFGLKESAGLPAWESYFESLKEAKRAGASRPGVIYAD